MNSYKSARTERDWRAWLQPEKDTNLREGFSGSKSPQVTGGGCANLFHKLRFTLGVSVISIAKYSQLAMAIVNSIKITISENNS